MTHPELEALPPMVPSDGTHQRPLTLAALLSGERRAVEAPWSVAFEDAAEAPTASEPEPSPPPITTLEELEALASRPLFADERPAANDAAASDTGSRTNDDLPVATFGPAAIRTDPQLPTLTRPELHQRIAADTLDRLAGLGEHRLRWPLGDKAETERRCLAQVDALVCLGSAAIGALSEAQARSPWTSWAVSFALGCLEGREALASIHQHLITLGPTQREHRRRAAEAFAASFHPHVIPLGRACLATPGCEPFALELLSLRGHLSSADLEAWLPRPDPEIRAVVLRALTRLPHPPTNVAALEPLLDTADPDQAWEAARALTLWGSGAPLSQLRHGGALLTVLGERALELIVLGGHSDDAELVQRLVRRLDPTPALLDAIARIGHPGTWAFLAHYLAEPTLADDAHAALKTAFGDLVDRAHRHDPDAWKQAIALLRLTDAQRIRRGQPWSPAAVAAECADPTLSAEAVERRFDELRARQRVQIAAPLWALTPLHLSFATDLTAALRRQGAIR